VQGNGYGCADAFLACHHINDRIINHCKLLKAFSMITLANYVGFITIAHSADIQDPILDYFDCNKFSLSQCHCNDKILQWKTFCQCVNELSVLSCCLHLLSQIFSFSHLTDSLQPLINVWVVYFGLVPYFIEIGHFLGLCHIKQSKILFHECTNKLLVSYHFCFLIISCSMVSYPWSFFQLAASLPPFQVFPKACCLSLAERIQDKYYMVCLALVGMNRLLGQVR